MINLKFKETSLMLGDKEVSATYLGDVAVYQTVKDLSKFDIYGNKIAQTTANCYVINKPGTYKFPLVFGCAIKNGFINPGSYTSPSYTITHDFVDYNGVIISSPYIENVSGSAYKAQLSIADTNNMLKNINIVDGDVCRYVQFTVNTIPDTGANGIISIVKSDGTIMWNWHIWIWPYDLTAIEIINSNGVAYNILPVNLATKLDTADSINKTTGWKNWFYQFGRPTPLLCPSSYNSTSNHASFGVLSYAAASIASNIQTGIKNPATFYKYSPSYNYNWFQTNSGKNYNLWDAACTSTGNSDNNVVKTIYDPCPIGFKMPNGNTFTYFSTSNVVGSFANGWKFKRYSGDTVGVFFPVSGYRNYSDDSLRGVGSYSTVWLSSANSQNYAYSLGFDSGYVNPQSNGNRAFGFSVRPVQEPVLYKELDYIESDGTQYIDTGYIPYDQTIVTLDCQLLDTQFGQFLYGCRKNNYTLGFGTVLSSVVQNFRGIFNSSYADFSLTDFSVRLNLTQDQNVFTINNTTVSANASNFTGAYSLYLFACNEGGIAKYLARMRLYSCKIYDFLNGVYVRDFVPAQTVDGKKGLYDKCQGLFYELKN